jgi:hypothetical protein
MGFLAEGNHLSRSVKRIVFPISEPSNWSCSSFARLTALHRNTLVASSNVEPMLVANLLMISIHRGDIDTLGTSTFATGGAALSAVVGVVVSVLGFELLMLVLHQIGVTITPQITFTGFFF